MDPVSNVDRLVLLLRQRLEERSRVIARQGGQRSVPAQPASIEGLEALAAVEAVDDRQFRRALIQSILAEQLGGKLINEAKFQQVVDRVAETLEADAASARLLDRVASDVRSAAR